LTFRIPGNRPWDILYKKLQKEIKYTNKGGVS
jgi:hypothetical protein